MKKLFLLFTVTIIVANLAAQGVRFPCQKEIAKGQYDKAIKVITEKFDKHPDDCAINYAFFKYYSTSKSPHYSVPMAYKWLVLANEQLSRADEKQFAKLLQQGFNFGQMQRDIDTLTHTAYNIAKSANTIEAYNTFLETYLEAPLDLRRSATRARDSLTFVEMEKIGTEEAYCAYVERYPASAYSAEAHRRAEEIRKTQEALRIANHIIEYGKQFPYSDLLWAKATGPVKQIVEVCVTTYISDDSYDPGPHQYTQVTTYSFDPVGQLISFAIDDEFYTISRDSIGRIVGLENYDAESEEGVFIQYDYNEYGLVEHKALSEIEIYDTEYILFNEHGWCLFGQDIMESDPYGVDYFECTFTSIDALGNWLECQTKYRNKFIQGSDKSKITTRRLTYWE